MAGTPTNTPCINRTLAVWCSALFPTFFLSLFQLGGWGWGGAVFAIISRSSPWTPNVHHLPSPLLLHHIVGNQNNSSLAALRSCFKVSQPWNQMCTSAEWDQMAMVGFRPLHGCKMEQQKEKKQQAKSILNVVLLCTLTFKAPLNQQPLTRDVVDWINKEAPSVICLLILVHPQAASTSATAMVHFQPLDSKSNIKPGLMGTCRFRREEYDTSMTQIWHTAADTAALICLRDFSTTSESLVQQMIGL